MAKMYNTIQKILIANRGEIAIRVIKTAKKLGIKTVAIFSDEDADSLHRFSADESRSLGGGSLQDTYLNIEKIIELAKKSDCQAIHPGYGFLSENHNFAKACEQSGIIFIGPSSEVIRLMGNKIEARSIAARIGIPMTKSIQGTAEQLLQENIDIPFPLIIKAAAGGGGKGMKIVESTSALAESIASASREAKNYFGDDTIYIEQYIEEPRHIEVQILADNFVNCIHLFERECTIQRRHQKIIEEAPSPTLSDEVRKKITDAAVKIAKSINYNNAGTIEFLLDNDMNFYFLEMNTRIQVEHPVTEFVTGIDIVEEQINIANGNILKFAQEDISIKGHSIECRIYAEDPANNFLPAPGEIIHYIEPANKNIRIDSAINSPTFVKSQYDPMIAKIISFGRNREDAIFTMNRALNDYIIQGIKQNIPYLKEILSHNAFIKNDISTAYCNKYSEELIFGIDSKIQNIAIENIIAGFLLLEFSKGTDLSIWERVGYWRALAAIELKILERNYVVKIIENNRNMIVFSIDNKAFKAELLKRNGNLFNYYIDNNYQTAAVARINSFQAYIGIGGLNTLVERQNVLHSDIIFETSELHNQESGNSIFSPMFGKLIKINVKPGDAVKKGETLLIIEAMKMENNISSHKDGIIETIGVSIGDTIESGKLLLTYME